ncbi:MAG: CapA family protein [Oscillospiraceae bacterium]|nr:CapA family protein [Oscillospiraceae bacterium]
MKLLKTAVCFAAVSAVMVYGCQKLYKDGEYSDIAGADVAAETVPPQETFTEVITEPVSDKEVSLTAGKSVTFTFLGDCLLASNEGDTRPDSFKAYAEKKPASYFFEKALPVYKDSDFVVANNEFVLTDQKLSKTAKTGTAFWFRSPSYCADILKSGGIDIVSIANNHTMDYGTKGYNDTAGALDSAGIMWGDIDHPVYVEKEGVKFGILCTNMFGANYEPIITPKIEELKETSDIQILFFHGGTEKEHIPEEWLTELCHKYADMGVDLIVGSHPHVLRSMENYNGVDIIYSLGNFCYGGSRLPENRTVILTETFNFDENGSYISQEESFTPFYVYGGEHNNWQPTPVTDPVEISKTLAFMYGAKDSPIDL